MYSFPCFALTEKCFLRMHNYQTVKDLKMRSCFLYAVSATICKNRECFVCRMFLVLHSFVHHTGVCTFKALCLSPERIPVLSLFQLYYESNAVQPTAPLKTKLNNSDMFSQNSNIKAVLKTVE